MKYSRKLIPYYGTKTTLAPRYPAPRHSRVREPFAGAAADETICDVWDYAITASAADIMRIPLVRDTRDLPGHLPSGAVALVGFWMDNATSTPRPRLCKRGRIGANPNNYWGVVRRQRVAETVAAISHWRIIHGDYRLVTPDPMATTFVDPPYQDRGKHYRCGSALIDYASLGRWCRSLGGQVIVCESERARWLPFTPLARVSSSTKPGTATTEAYWTNDVKGGVYGKR